MFSVQLFSALLEPDVRVPTNRVLNPGCALPDAFLRRHQPVYSEERLFAEDRKQFFL
jgi:hypothetical protein